METINETPEQRKSCYDCKYLKGYVSLWCKNEQAIEHRGTSIPGCIHCPFWEKMKNKDDFLPPQLKSSFVTMSEWQIGACLCAIVAAPILIMGLLVWLFQ